MESTFAITATAPAKDYQFQNIRPGYILGGNIRFPNFSLRAFWGSEDFSLPMGAPNMRNWGYFVNIGASQMALLGMWGVFVTNTGSRLALLRRWEFVVINEGVPTFLLEEVRIFVMTNSTMFASLLQRKRPISKTWTSKSLSPDWLRMQSDFYLCSTGL